MNSEKRGAPLGGDSLKFEDLIARHAPNPSADGPCPDPEDLAAWAEGAEVADDVGIVAHVARCEECRLASFAVNEGMRDHTSSSTKSTRKFSINQVLALVAAAVVLVGALLIFAPKQTQVEPSFERLVAALPDKISQETFSGYLDLRILAEEVEQSIAPRRSSKADRLLSPRGAILNRLPTFVFEVPMAEEGETDTYFYRVDVRANGNLFASLEVEHPPSLRGSVLKKRWDGVTDLDLNVEYTWNARLDPELHPGLEEAYHPDEAAFRIVDEQTRDALLSRTVQDEGPLGDLARASVLLAHEFYEDASRELQHVKERTGSGDPEHERLFLFAALLNAKARIAMRLDVEQDALGALILRINALDSQ